MLLLKQPNKWLELIEIFHEPQNLAGDLTYPQCVSLKPPTNLMPTIELVSIGCIQPPDLPSYRSFTYCTETELQSHRGLFQQVFDGLKGVIAHLANKELEHTKAGCWFAGDLINWNETGDDAKGETSTLIFQSDALLDIRDLMQRLLAASPQKRIIFSTDYQFGGNRRERGNISLSQLFELHANRELHFNHLWHVHPDS